MKVYNEDKTQELQEYDLSKGYLQPDKLFIKHYDAVEEQGHYETIKEYANGGKDVEWVVDVKGVEEHDEFEDIQIYIPYTEQEIAEIRISELKGYLYKTDYQAIKYAEGEISAEEYAPIKEQRRQWRAEINRLEEQQPKQPKNKPQMIIT